MPQSIECNACKEVYDEVRRLEDKTDERYLEFKKCSIEYKAKKEQEIASIKAIHARMDKQDEQRQELKEVVTKHMDTEDAHNLKMEKYMSKIDEVLEHVATKEDVAKIDGRVNTLWIVGTIAGVVMTAIIGTMFSYIVDDVKTHITTQSKESKKDVKTHITKSSKANYYGVKKVIKQQEQR